MRILRHLLGRFLAGPFRGRLQRSIAENEAAAARLDAAVREVLRK